VRVVCFVDIDGICDHHCKNTTKKNDNINMDSAMAGQLMLLVN
jgi:hypothetical protein